MQDTLMNGMVLFVNARDVVPKYVDVMPVTIVLIAGTNISRGMAKSYKFNT
jgi:hypothetical protein